MGSEDWVCDSEGRFVKHIFHVTIMAIGVMVSGFCTKPGVEITNDKHVMALWLETLYVGSQGIIEFGAAVCFCQSEGSGIVNGEVRRFGLSIKAD